MKRPLVIFLLFLVAKNNTAQIISNGDFSSGTTSWGCAAETGPESTYGGSSSNPIAEVDAAAGLCQTVTGLTIGNVYALSFKATRRTGGCPSPATTNVNVTVSGGVLSTTVTRTNTTFGFTTTTYLFTANSATHTVTFAAGAGFGTSTCGMIMDDIAIAFSPLPIELIYFEGVMSENGIKFTWSTASEKNNDYFEIEKSENGLDFTKIITVPSKAPNGTSNLKLNYENFYPSTNGGVKYYRLKQVDFDKSYSYSKLIVPSSASSKSTFLLYPNPNTGEFDIDGAPQGPLRLSVINSLGEEVFSQLISTDQESNHIHIDLKNKLISGIYHCVLFSSDYRQTGTVIIE